MNDLAFASLGSGSRGNATLVRSDSSLLMVDCGFTLKETEQRLLELGHQPNDVNAILVTHEHGDHIRGVGPFARKYKIPVYATHGTAYSTTIAKVPALHLIDLSETFDCFGFTVTPVAVPHDAREPCQFVFQRGTRRFGVLTDLGSITPHIIEQYGHCDGLMLECNHDSQMLATGPYPRPLKLRVGGRWGHLNNVQAANFLAEIDCAAYSMWWCVMSVSRITGRNWRGMRLRRCLGPAGSWLLPSRMRSCHGVRWFEPATCRRRQPILLRKILDS